MGQEIIIEPFKIMFSHDECVKYSKHENEINDKKVKLFPILKNGSLDKYFELPLIEFLEHYLGVLLQTLLCNYNGTDRKIFIPMDYDSYIEISIKNGEIDFLLDDTTQLISANFYDLIRKILICLKNQINVGIIENRIHLQSNYFYNHYFTIPLVDEDEILNLLKNNSK